MDKQPLPYRKNPVIRTQAPQKEPQKQNVCRHGFPPGQVLRTFVRKVGGRTVFYQKWVEGPAECTHR
jgi:hypothetical protein